MSFADFCSSTRQSMSTFLTRNDQVFLRACSFVYSLYVRGRYLTDTSRVCIT
jgi:hypothetical protein